MVRSGRARAWCLGALAVVSLQAACAGRSDTRGDDDGSGGASTGGASTAGASTGGGGASAGVSAGGMSNTGGRPVAGGAAGAGPRGGTAGIAGSTSASGTAGVAAGAGDTAGEGGESAGGRSGASGEGGVGVSSAGEGGTPGCEADHCACEGWWGDCDHRPGCEAPLDGPDNCGSCGVAATVHANTRTVCSSPGGSLPICEPGFADCNLDELDCETTYGGGEPSCLPEYLGSLSLDTMIGVTALGYGPNGELYLSGSFTGPVDFDPGASSDLIALDSYYSAFVTKLAADGSYLWTRVFGGTSDASVWGVDSAVAPDGSVLFVGSLEGNADLDPSDASDVHTAPMAAFVVALSAAGDYRFGRSFVSSDTVTWGSRVSLGDDGVSYVLTGYENIAPEPDVFIPPGVRLTKLDAAGESLWSRASGTCGAIPAGAVATSAGATLALGLETSCALEGFSGELASQNPTRAAGLLARFDSSGAGLGFGFFEGEDPSSMASVSRLQRSGDGNLFVAGLLEGKSDLDPGPAKASRGLAVNDISTFVARLDETHSLVWAQSVPSFGFENMIVSDDGGVFLSGYPVDGWGPEILAFAPDSRSRFALGFNLNISIGALAANAQQLAVVGQASAAVDIDPTNGVDVSERSRVFLARFALNGE